MVKIVSQKTVYETRWIKVVDLQIEFSKTTQNFQIVEKNDSAMIVPVTNDGKLILIKEYFAASNSYLLTFPKGRVDEGEDPQSTIIRELQEEAGFKPQKVKLLTSLLVSPGYLKQKTFVYLCRDLVESSMEGDEGEKPEVKTFTFDEVEKMIESGEIQEARVIAAFYLTKKHLKK